MVVKEPTNIGTTDRIAGLAVEQHGVRDGRAPLLLIHGLSFDRAMWRPALAELQKTDPARRSIAIDLPGHGDSPAWPSYALEDVAAAINAVCEEAELGRPVMVGHSIGAVIATVYASEYPTSGIIAVDQTLDVGFASLLRQMAGGLRGPGFPQLWGTFLGSMGMDVLPGASRDLLRPGFEPAQDLVLGYWREALETPIAALEGRVDRALARIRDLGVPFLMVAGREPGSEYRAWLEARLPTAAIVALPGSGHFPHLAYPARFAELMAGFALREQ